MNKNEIITSIDFNKKKNYLQTGAVVAREYGLPCLVGVQKAKKHFKTGIIKILKIN